MPPTALRLNAFTESVIGELTRVASTHGAINGFVGYTLDTLLRAAHHAWTHQP